MGQGFFLVPSSRLILWALCHWWQWRLFVIVPISSRCPRQFFEARDGFQNYVANYRSFVYASNAINLQVVYVQECSTNPWFQESRRRCSLPSLESSTNVIDISSQGSTSSSGTFSVRRYVNVLLTIRSGNTTVGADTISMFRVYSILYLLSTAGLRYWKLFLHQLLTYIKTILHTYICLQVGLIKLL